MRTLIFILTSIYSVFAFSSDELPSKGIYWNSFENGCIGCDATFISNDYFYFSITGNELTFDQYTNFYNGHTCSISGTAINTSNNQYEYLYSGQDNSTQCRFLITFNPVGLKTELVEGDRGCMSSCGVRGSIYETEFPQEGFDKSPFHNLSDYEICQQVTLDVESTPHFSEGFYDGNLEAEMRGLTAESCAILLNKNWILRLFGQ